MRIKPRILEKIKVFYGKEKPRQNSSFNGFYSWAIKPGFTGLLARTRTRARAQEMFTFLCSSSGRLAFATIIVQKGLISSYAPHLFYWTKY